MLDELGSCTLVSVGFVDDEVSEPAYIAVTDRSGKADSFIIINSHEAAFRFQFYHEFEVIFQKVPPHLTCDLNSKR